MRPYGSGDLAMFPGQGSQRPGMATHLLREHPAARRLFNTADAVLGLPLAEICVSGTEEELARTEITQPAIVATSLAVWEVLYEHGYRPAVVAGHSLGEYAALVAAGVLPLDSALQLVQLRGRLMAEVAAQVPGAMAAVLGLSSEQVLATCSQSRQLGAVEVANFNEPLQTVVSGQAAAVQEVGRAALAAGADKVVTLNVGAPFHCSLMQPIEDEFTAELARHEFADPALPVISSVTGEYIRSGANAKALLRRQLTGAVRWVDVIRRADGHPVTAYAEIGPGRVLSGLARRTLPDAKTHSTGDQRRLDALLAARSPQPVTAG